MKDYLAEAMGQYERPWYEKVTYSAGSVVWGMAESVTSAVDTVVELGGGDLIDDDTFNRLATDMSADFGAFYTENEQTARFVGDIILAIGTGVGVSSLLRTASYSATAIQMNSAPRVAAALNSVGRNLFKIQGKGRDVDLAELGKLAQTARSKGVVNLKNNEAFATAAANKKSYTISDTVKDFVWGEVGVGLAFYENENIGMAAMIEDPALPLAIGGSLAALGALVSHTRMSRGIRDLYQSIDVDSKAMDSAVGATDEATKNILDVNTYRQAQKDVSTLMEDEIGRTEQDNMVRELEAQIPNSIRDLSGTRFSTASTQVKLYSKDQANKFISSTDNLDGAVVAVNEVNSAVSRNVVIPKEQVEAVQEGAEQLLAAWKGKAMDGISEDGLKVMATQLSLDALNRGGDNAASVLKSYGSMDVHKVQLVSDGVFGRNFKVPKEDTKVEHGEVSYDGRIILSGVKDVEGMKIGTYTLIKNASTEQMMGAVQGAIRETGEAWASKIDATPEKLGELGYIELEALQRAGKELDRNLQGQMLKSKFETWQQLQAMRDSEGEAVFSNLEMAQILNLPMSKGLGNHSQALYRLQELHIENPNGFIGNWAEEAERLVSAEATAVRKQAEMASGSDEAAPGLSGYYDYKQSADVTYVPNEELGDTDLAIGMLSDVNRLNAQAAAKEYATHQPALSDSSVRDTLDLMQGWVNSPKLFDESIGSIKGLMMSKGGIARGNALWNDLYQRSRTVTQTMHNANTKIPELAYAHKTMERWLNTKTDPSAAIFTKAHQAVAKHTDSPLEVTYADGKATVYKLDAEGNRDVFKYGEAGDVDMVLPEEVGKVLESFMSVAGMVRQRYNTLATNRAFTTTTFNNAVVPVASFGDEFKAVVTAGDDKHVATVTGRSKREVYKKARAMSGDVPETTIQVTELKEQRAIDLLNKVGSGNWTHVDESDAFAYTKAVLTDNLGMLNSLDTSAWEMLNKPVLDKARLASMRNGSGWQDSVTTYSAVRGMVLGTSIAPNTSQAVQFMDTIDDAAQWGVDTVWGKVAPMFESAADIANFAYFKGNLDPKGSWDKMMYESAQEMVGGKENSVFKDSDELRKMSKATGYPNYADFVSDMNNIASYVYVRALSVPNAVLNYAGAFVNTPAVLRNIINQHGGDMDMGTIDTVKMTMGAMKSIRNNPHITKMGEDAGIISGSTDEALGQDLHRSGIFGKIMNVVNGKYTIKGVDPLTLFTKGSDYQVQQMTYHMGYQLADQLGIVTEAGKQALAAQMVGDVSGIYTRNNRPVMFQSATTSNAALFLTYAWNWFENLAHIVGTGQTNTAVRMLTTQAMLFGLEGTPGSAQIIDWVSKMNDEDGDPYAVSAKYFGKDTADMLFFGGISNLPKMFGGEAVNLAASGNMGKAPQLGLQIQPASVNMVKNWYGFMNDTLKQGMEAGLTVETMGEIIATHANNRAVRGLGYTLADKVVDRGGMLVDKEINSTTEIIGNAIGLRTVQQDVNKRVLRNKRIRDGKLQQERKDFVKRMRRVVREGGIEQIDMERALEVYLKTGGDVRGFKYWIKRIGRTATMSKAELAIYEMTTANSNLTHDMVTLEALQENNSGMW